MKRYVKRSDIVSPAMEITLRSFEEIRKRLKEHMDREGVYRWRTAQPPFNVWLEVCIGGDVYVGKAKPADPTGGPVRGKPYWDLSNGAIGGPNAASSWRYIPGEELDERE